MIKNQELKYRTNTILGVLAGLLIGSFAGATTMLLLAPQSGKKTRMQIQKKSIELREQASDMLEDTMAQVNSEGKKLNKEGRHKAKELMLQGQALITEQLEHVSDAVKSGKKSIMNI